MPSRWHIEWYGHAARASPPFASHRTAHSQIWLSSRWWWPLSPSDRGGHPEELGIRFILNKDRRNIGLPPLASRRPEKRPLRRDLSPKPAMIPLMPATLSELASTLSEPAPSPSIRRPTNFSPAAKVNDAATSIGAMAQHGCHLRIAQNWNYAACGICPYRRICAKA